MTLLLLLLALVPIVAYRFTRRRDPAHLLLVSGLALGAVIAPFSIGLYATFFIPYVGLAPGMLGLLLVTIHSAPGFHLARLLGIVSPAEIIAGNCNLCFVLLNAAIWALVYGSLGALVDRLRQRKGMVGARHGQG
jgi:hypothetical protein